MQYEVTPEQFAAQLAYLQAEGYTAVLLPDVARAMRGESELPEKPVAITIDDGRATQYEFARPLLRKHGFAATYYVFSNAVDRPDYLTGDQLRELVSGGDAVECHTRYHHFLTKENDAGLEAEVAGSKKRLEEILGRPVTSLAYPFGKYDDRVVAAAKSAGYETARGLNQVNLQAAGTELTLGGHIVMGSLDALKGVLARP